MRPLIVFTAMDGALLDETTGSVRPALPALDALLRRGATIVPVSGFTASQIRIWMRHLYLSGPFVSENGCSITLPKGYIPWPIEGSTERGSEVRIRLGDGVDASRRHLASIAAEVGVAVRPLGTMTEDEIGALCGLKGEEVASCLDREHDEPFLVEDGDRFEGDLTRAAQKRGCHLRRVGPLFHLWTGCSKGEAVRVLAGLYLRLEPRTLTAAIGACAADTSMLHAVDRAYLLRRSDGSCTVRPEGGWVTVDGAGPRGWRKAVEDLIAFWTDAGEADAGSGRGGDA